MLKMLKIVFIFTIFFGQSFCEISSNGDESILFLPKDFAGALLTERLRGEELTTKEK
jgi:hypothetical protein